MTLPLARVLIAEDDYFLAEQLAEMVRSMGHDVVAVVADGRSAVEQVQRLRPDLLLLDLRMPRMTGIEAAREIQREHPTPIVVVSAFDDDELLSECSELGVYHYLVKPPDRRALARAIALTLARYREVDSGREGESRGVLTICCHCKWRLRGRGENGRWREVAPVLLEELGIVMSHGICPSCMKEHYDIDPDGESVD